MIITRLCTDLSPVLLEIKIITDIATRGLTPYKDAVLPVRWRLKSPASRLFTQLYVPSQIKGNIKLRVTGSKETSKLRVTGLWEGNSPVTGEFPAQMASNAENVSIWWRHHVLGYWRTQVPCFVKLIKSYGNHQMLVNGVLINSFKQRIVNIQLHVCILLEEMLFSYTLGREYRVMR